MFLSARERERKRKRERERERERDGQTDKGARLRPIQRKKVALYFL